MCVDREDREAFCFWGNLINYFQNIPFGNLRSLYSGHDTVENLGSVRDMTSPPLPFHVRSVLEELICNLRIRKFIHPKLYVQVYPLNLGFNYQALKPLL